MNQWEDKTQLTCEFSNETAIFCINNGTQILDEAKVDTNQKPIYFSMLVILIIIWRIIAYIILLIKASKLNFKFNNFNFKTSKIEKKEIKNVDKLDIIIDSVKF